MEKNRLIIPEVGKPKDICIVYNPITEESRIISNRELEESRKNPMNMIISGKDIKDAFSKKLFSSDYKITCPKCDNDIKIPLEDML